ncbi:hypothetical protein [Cellulomonas sp. Marseille-Q8402]
MTTTTESRVRLDFGGLLRAEVIKARGLRSTRWLLALVVLLPVVIAAIVAASTDTAGAAHADLTAAALSGVTSISWVPLLLTLQLGTVIGTAEYERGAVQTTFAAVPRRTPVVLAKAVLVAAALLVAVLVTDVISYLVGAALLGGQEPAGLGDPGVVRVLAGTALYAAAAGTIAMCLGMVVRSSIGAFAATLGFLYVLPALLQAVPVEVVGWFARTIPGPASTPLELPGHPDGQLTFGAALVAVVLWTAAWIVLTCVVVRRRDV